jgi:hypothetical protein
MEAEYRWRGKMEKVDLIGGEGGILKLAGWAVIIWGESLLTMKKVKK